MKNNIFLFTGEEKFLVYQEIGKWKKSFVAKYGAGNVFEFKSEDIDIGAIQNTIFSGGLFVVKKLVLIWGLPKDTDSDNKVSESKYKNAETKIIEFFENIPDDVVVVFVSFTPDKRTAGYKFISVNCQVKTFDKLSDKDKKQFTKNILGDKVTEDEISYFLEMAGEDLFSINNEAIKLNYYAQENNTKITKQVIDKVIYSKNQINTFDILDKMFFNKEKTIQLLTGLQEQGFDTFQLLGMLYWGLRTVILIMELYKKGETSIKEIASKIGLHPFVVTKNIKIINHLLEKEEDIKLLFKALVEIDFNIKTGKIPAELFWLEVKNLILKQ